MWGRNDPFGRYWADMQNVQITSPVLFGGLLCSKMPPPAQGVPVWDLSHHSLLKYHAAAPSAWADFIVSQSAFSRRGARFAGFEPPHLRSLARLPCGNPAGSFNALGRCWQRFPAGFSQHLGRLFEEVGGPRFHVRAEISYRNSGHRDQSGPQRLELETGSLMLRWWRQSFGEEWRAGSIEAAGSLRARPGYQLVSCVCPSIWVLSGTIPRFQFAKKWQAATWRDWGWVASNQGGKNLFIYIYIYYLYYICN